MTTISTFIDYIIQSYSQKKLWVLFAAMWVVLIWFGLLGFYIGIGLPIDESGEMIKLLDVMFNYDQEQAYRHLEAYGDNGRTVCLFTTLVVDTLFPLIYGAFLALLLARLFRETRYRFFILLPILVMLVDYIENTHTALLLINFPDQMPLVVYTGSFFTSAKWILLGIILMSISFGFFLKNRKHFLYRPEGNYPF